MSRRDILKMASCPYGVNKLPFRPDIAGAVASLTESELNAVSERT